MQHKLGIADWVLFAAKKRHLVPAFSLAVVVSQRPVRALEKQGATEAVESMHGIYTEEAPVI